ncbi:alpha/beta-hydrolase [Auriculariales sp. MPI-PUGE-AT-0066]|nr:alpha/beta-hydrolase [Auriculariales sp. MPI-PUGE-AT-0066]
MVQGRSIDVETAHGRVQFNYFISTPQDTFAHEIDPQLPTLLFLHPAGLASPAWHFQFTDPSLRRFNLVALDSLSHGKTKGDVPEVYGQVEMARDVAAFMETIKLPPCIIVGLSLGTIIGLQLALLYPKRSLACILCRHLEQRRQPEDVQAGRREIWSTWCEMFVGGDIEEETLVHCMFGGIQLAFNGLNGNMVRTIARMILADSIQRWGPGKFDAKLKTTVNVLTDRKSYDLQTLAQLSSIPLALVHCSEDIAFPKEYLEVFISQLCAAGVGFDVHDIPGAPHFGSVTHSQLINPTLACFVENHWNGPDLPGVKASSEFKSPFEEGMRKLGWKDDGDGSGEDSDDNQSFLVPS